MRISAHVQRIVAAPPWFVRVFGIVWMSADGYWWHLEHNPATVLELVKHGILLAIGLAMFYPEGLSLVINSARRLPFFDRRTQPRPPTPPTTP